MRDKCQTTEEVYIALGSNVGNREMYIKEALLHLQREVFCSAVRCSSLYETKPVGYLDQPNFFNMVVSGMTDMEPTLLLLQLHRIEEVLERERKIRFGPRTIDLDILLFGDLYICFKNLQVPHPRMWERSFVMVPLAELTPLRRALGGETVGALANRLQKEGDIRYVRDICTEVAGIQKTETLDSSRTWGTTGC